MNRHALAALIFAGTIPCSVAAIAEPAGIPDALRPPSDEHLAFVVNAHGAQIYRCAARPSDDPKSYGWVFVAPEATLLDNDEKVGYHFAGPIWESASDLSSVKGVVRERQDAGAGNIPWLLLSGTPSANPGRFAGVTSILRVATRGGAVPGAKCDPSVDGREIRAKYTADYYFYKRGPAKASQPSAY